MRALTLQTADGLGAAKLDTVPKPEPGTGQVRVELKAAALNHRELWIAKGLYPGMALPATLGCDGAGVVDAVGEGVDKVLIGREVVLYPGLGWGDDPRWPAPAFALLGMPGPGTVADYIVLAADDILPKPAHLDFVHAAALPLAILTAWRGIVTKAELKTGEKLLITGIGGGVAAAALQLAVAMGAEVYVTSSSDETIGKAVALGAKAGFNYHDETWKKTLGKATGGIDVVFDGAPATGYPSYGRSLNLGARVVVYGSTGGMAFQVNAPELFLKNIRLMGTNVGNRAELEDALAFVSEHAIIPAIDRRFSLEEATQALAHLDASHGFGKVVIEIAG